MNIATQMVSEFLKQVDPNTRKFYARRDNCGPAATDMLFFLKKKGIETTRVYGHFKADKIVSEWDDFTPEMKKLYLRSGEDKRDKDARASFIENDPAYASWNEIPHYWLVDEEGTIYDPTGNAQFIKTGLASDLASSRYIPA